MNELADRAFANRATLQNLAEVHWFNALWFQTTWFCAVLGRHELLPVIAALLGLHLVLVRDTGRELLKLSALAAVGISVDAGLSATGVYQFQGGALVPLWLCGLWLAFATTTTRSLSFLASRPRLTALAGAVVLPLNYWAGQRLGAVEFGYSLPITLAAMSATWLVMLPVIYRLSRLLDGVRVTYGER